MYNELPTNLAAESNKHVLLHTVSGGQGSRNDWVGWFWLSVFHKVKVKWPWGHHQRSVGPGLERKLLAGRFTSMPPHRGLSQGCLKSLDRPAGSPGWGMAGKAATGSHSILYDPVPEPHAFSSTSASWLDANQEGWSMLKGRRMKLHLLKRRISKYSKHLKITTQAFPGSPVVKNPHLHCRKQRFHSWLGNWDPTYCTAEPKNKFLKFTT